MTLMAIDAYRSFALKWRPGLEEEILEGPGLERRALRGELRDDEVVALFRYGAKNFPEELERFCRELLEAASEETLERIRDQYRAAQRLHEIRVELLRRRSERRAKLSIVR